MCLLPMEFIAHRDVLLRLHLDPELGESATLFGAVPQSLRGRPRALQWEQADAALAGAELFHAADAVLREGSLAVPAERLGSRGPDETTQGVGIPEKVGSSSAGNLPADSPPKDQVNTREPDGS